MKVATLGEVHQFLEDTMEKYGIKHADLGHIMDRDCFCHPVTICAECESPGPCIHGDDRAEVVVHKRSS